MQRAKFIPDGLVLLIFSILTAVPFSDVLAQRSTDQTELRRLAGVFEREWDSRRTPLYYNLLSSIDPAQAALNRNRDILLIYIGTDGRPVYYGIHNLNAARTISTDEAWPGGATGYGLTGAGTAGNEFAIWDGGGVRTTHQELTGRVTQQDSPASLSNHSTHVAGTMGAAGMDASAQGMSFQANLDAYDWDFDLTEMATAAANGLQVSNHSYGRITGWNFNSDDGFWYWYGDISVSTIEDYGFGFYGEETQDLDEIAWDAPDYLIVKSAGNERNDFGPGDGGGHFVWDGGWVWSTDTRDPDGGADSYDCVGWAGNAKNILTVGAVNDIPGGWTGSGDVVQTSFSSWGPTDDGRIKPDIVGNGAGLFSCVATGDNDYDTFDGTSMSTPNVSGSINLLVGQYESLIGTPTAATMKALVIHTADEAGPSDGPDYQNGWGLMNTETAADLIAGAPTISNIVEATLTDGDTDVFTFTPETVAEFVRATLVWTDPAGTPPAPSLNPATPMLVNDLDTRIELVAAATVYDPWVLDGGNPGNAATTGDNTVDNVEQVHIANAQPGEYRVTISHKGSLASPQDYSLIWSVGNQTPVAQCQEFSGDADENCCITVEVGDIDGGSYDPDGDDDIDTICITAVDGIPVGCQQSVEVCGVGDHLVTLTITDLGGAFGSCDASVEVFDTTPPELTVDLNRYVLWPPNHKLSEIIATITVEDNCDADPTVVLTSITSDEPDNGLGDGDTENDIQGADIGTYDVEFQLRSERSGSADGREYTIVYTATDDSGNFTEVTVVVRVPHDQSGFALSGRGFNQDRTGFASGARVYSVVIPSGPGHDPTHIDASLAYSGNTFGALLPVSHRLHDINSDDISDLELSYDVAATLELLGQSAGEEPVGLHYTTVDGIDYWVADIFDLELSTSAVPEAVADLVRLEQPAPNPMSGRCELEYAIPGTEKASVSICVYNVAGQRIRVLVSGYRDPGTYTAEWDGRNTAGDAVRSGIYFVRARIGNEEKMIRVTMTR